MAGRKIFYSHYDEKEGTEKVLEVHLHEMAEAACDSVPPFLHFDRLDQKQIVQLLHLQALFHDLGKYTDYFQDYLVHKINSGFKNHAHISAYLFYRYMQDHPTFNALSKPERGIVLFLLYVLVRCHHRDLSLANLFENNQLHTMRNTLREQMKNLRRHKSRLCETYHLEPETVEKLLSDAQVLEEEGLLLGERRIGRKKTRHERWYFLLIYLFSQLVDKDKISAANVVRRPRKSFDPEWVKVYITQKQKGIQSCVNDHREAMRRTVNHSIDALTDKEIEEIRIFTLTAPTGMGKTLTSLQAAMKLCNRIESTCGYSPKLITAIPFINIIEQTKNDYVKILKDRGSLNVHHRLADKRLQEHRTSSEDVPLEKSLLEVEAWEGDIVLTTFVQLFQSLFTGSNARLKKINKLAGSVVILDEVQSIPEPYMPLVGAVLIKLSEYFGTRFILMSATQPYLLPMGKALLNYRRSEHAVPETHESKELLPDYKRYYARLARSRLIPSFEQEMNTESFVDFFQKTWRERSAVVVVNTIRRCSEIYAVLKNRLKGVQVYHLSTNLIPKERKRVIEEVDAALKDGETVVLVSTQTIEAGVDLDFKVGYRDLAPLESIIQTAGRVNRSENLRDEHGNPVACPVYIVQLENDHKKIYPMHHLERTKSFLNGRPEIAEREYLEMVDEYYRHMAGHTPDESVEIWTKGIQSLDFEMISSFQLIKEAKDVIDVFVEWDDEAERLADAYEMIRLSEDPDVEWLSEVIGEKIELDADGKLPAFREKALTRLLVGRMSEYMVQVRFHRYRELKALKFADRNGVEATFDWVPRQQITQFYDPEVGYGNVKEAWMW